MLERFEQHFERFGWGVWAVEFEGRLAGLTGLTTTELVTPMGAHVSVGWRYARWAWGRGYASEAARASLEWGFTHLGANEVYAYTTATNAPSEAVMRRIGMRRREDLDFDHPLTPGWWGQRHVVYEVTRDQWRRAAPVSG